MGAGINEGLRQIRRTSGPLRAPGTSVDEDIHWCVRPPRWIHVNFLDLCRTVGKPLWRSKTRERRGALLSVALGDFSLSWRPGPNCRDHDGVGRAMALVGKYTRGSIPRRECCAPPALLRSGRCRPLLDALSLRRTSAGQSNDQSHSGELRCSVAGMGCAGQEQQTPFDRDRATTLS